MLHLVILRQDFTRIRRPIQLALVGHPEIPVAAPRHRRLLNPAWAENATFRAIAADALRHGKYLHLENAFADDFARQTAAAIEGDLGRMKLHGNVKSGTFDHRECLQRLNHSVSEQRCWSSARGPPKFRYHHHNLYPKDGPMGEQLAELVDDARIALSGEGSMMRAIVYAAFGFRPSALSIFAASHYRAGDFSFPHNDKVYGRDVAVVWHLSEGFEEKDGGGMIWCNPFHKLAPKFNSLTMFLVTDCSNHFVEPVFAGTSDDDAARPKRLAINGWFVNVVEEYISDHYGHSPPLLAYRDAQPIPARTAACQGFRSLLGGEEFSFEKTAGGAESCAAF